MSFIVAPPLQEVTDGMVRNIRQQLAFRTYRAANELRNSAIEILRGQRGGRRYRLPNSHGYYTASAPGEPPAVRSGVFRNSWQPAMTYSANLFQGRIESTHTVNGYVLGELLENGTSRMAPRPHHDKILEDAEPKIIRIYEEPYF